MKLLATALFPALLLGSTVPLFNGRDLQGWVHEGDCPTFAATGGELRTSGRGNFPNWLRTASEYENFRLRFEYKLAQWAEAAVVMRAPRWGRPAQAGVAIVLAHDYHKVVDNYVTGAVAGAQPPIRALPASFGEWHTAEILLDGERLRTSVDGVAVQDLDISEHAELRYRLKRGYIGFQDLGYGYSLRNIEIEDLGSRLKYIRLFDGESLKGWEARGAGNWSVRGGSLAGENSDGILYAPPLFGDFELTTQVLSHRRVNSGIFLRGFPAGPNRGFEVQIYSPMDGVYPTGSIYTIDRSRISADYEERWFLMQIRVEGSSCLVRIDGQTVAQTANLPEAVRKPGRIGFQIHSENSGVEFRDISVRPL